MGAGAQIGEFALAVEGDLRVLRKILDQFHLVGLALSFIKCDGFLPGQGKALQLGRSSLMIFFISASNFSRSLCREGRSHVKIIVKSVLDGRADGQLRRRDTVVLPPGPARGMRCGAGRPAPSASPAVRIFSSQSLETTCTQILQPPRLPLRHRPLSPVPR